MIFVFALALIPTLGFIGASIDYSNAYRMRTKLQDALDSAALAAGREVDMGGSARSAQDIANKVLEANLGAGFPSYTATFNIDSSTKSVVASANVDVDTYLLGLFGYHILPVSVNSTVRLPNGKVEVALVLDNSGSMAGSRIRDLKDAAKRLTQILYQSNPGTDFVKIGVVPFAAAVNVDPANANASWMDTAGRSPIHFENFDQPITRFTMFNRLRGTRWDGCVEVRQSPHDVTDTPPDPGTPATYFVPMFAPDEPDTGRRYSNSYLSDDGGDCGRAPGGETEEQAQEKTCKYVNEQPSWRSSGPNYLCDSQPIQPLTQTQGQVISAIETMQANGRTNIHEGVMWGWRVLSPEEPFTEGRPYTDRENRKIMIVMTDGANTHGGKTNQNMSDYSAYGYAKDGRLTAPTTRTADLVAAMNTKTLQACTNAKTAGIIVYTIAFNINDPDTLALLSSCATSRSRAFTIQDGDALIAVFEAIAGEINKLRIAS